MKIKKENLEQLEKFFWDQDKKIRKKNLLFFLFLGFIGYGFHYFFLIIHELSHTITAIILGLKIFKIMIDFKTGNGYVVIEKISGIRAQVFYISGSCGSSFVFMLLIGIMYYDNKIHFFNFFFPCLWIFFFGIFRELRYWFLCDIKESDAYKFLEVTPELTPFLLQVIVIVLILLSVLGLLYIMKKKYHQTLKEYYGPRKE